MIESMSKLNNTKINPYLMHLYFNTRLLNNSFFGCGVIKIKDHQNKAIRKMHEKNRKNITLASNFTGVALNSRKNAVRIGFIKPKTAVAMLACKLYIVNAK